MPTKSPAPPRPATHPDTIPLEHCRHCAGNGCQPTADSTLERCVACGGSGWQAVAGDLGSTRSYKCRPFMYSPGTGILTVTRGNKTEEYTLAEFAPQTDFPARAFECVRVTGVRAGEVYHLLASRGGITCDCAGRTYEGTARANRAAYYAGQPQCLSAGCIHADAVTLFLAAGLFDLPTEAPPADQPEPILARASEFAAPGGAR